VLQKYWTPAFTGVTTFDQTIKIGIAQNGHPIGET
jgi:hypothetical protein